MMYTVPGKCNAVRTYRTPKPKPKITTTYFLSSLLSLSYFSSHISLFIYLRYTS